MSRALRSTLLALAAVVVQAGCDRSSADAEDEETAPIAVACAPVRKAAATSTVTLRGIVAAPPGRDAVVAAAVAGRLVEVRAREGDQARAGDVLAVVDDPALAAAVAEGDADLSAARAAVTHAEADLARALRLVDKGIAPRRDADDAVARRADAAATLEGARARHRLAVRQRERARVKAPIAGVIIHVFRRPGDLVDGTPATPVVEIADPAALEVRADAPAADLVRLREGLPVEIALDAVPDRSFPGAIDLLSPSVDPATSLGVVHASIDASGAEGPQPRLGLAGRITARIPGRASAVLVPAVAVRRSVAGVEEVVVCEAVGGAGPPARWAARVRPIRVGARSDGEVEVLCGLAAGDQVVVHHVLGLEDGAEIRLEPRASAPGPVADPGRPP